MTHLKRRAAIIGTGSYLPARIVSNEDQPDPGDVTLQEVLSKQLHFMEQDRTAGGQLRLFFEKLAVSRDSPGQDAANWAAPTLPSAVGLTVPRGVT